MWPLVVVVTRQIAQHVGLSLPLAGIAVLRHPLRFQASEKRSIGALSQHYPRDLMRDTVTNALLATAESDGSGKLGLLIQQDGEVRF